MFKLFDKVVSKRLGKGVVTEVRVSGTYVLTVFFESGSRETFSALGWCDYTLQSEEDDIVLIEKETTDSLLFEMAMSLSAMIPYAMVMINDNHPVIKQAKALLEKINKQYPTEQSKQNGPVL